MFPCGQSLPLASTLNSVDGRVKAAAAILPAGTNGGVCAFATQDTELILDINGYFVSDLSPSVLEFYPLAPCRLVDTRSAAGSLGGPSLVGAASRTFPILSSPCNIPATAKAYSLNFTSVPKGPLGFLTTWPAGSRSAIRFNLECAYRRGYGQCRNRACRNQRGYLSLCHARLGPGH